MQIFHLILFYRSGEFSPLSNLGLFPIQNQSEEKEQHSFRYPKEVCGGRRGDNQAEVHKSEECLPSEQEQVLDLAQT